MTSNEILRVCIENKDGSLRYIEGIMAEKWNDACIGVAQFAHAHGQDYFKDIKWIEVPAPQS